MEPLVTHKRLLMWLSVWHPGETTGRKRTFTLIIFVSLLTFAAASVIFFVENLRTNLNESVQTLFQIVSYSTGLYLNVVAVVSRRRVVGLLEDLSKIYEKCKTQS